MQTGSVRQSDACRWDGRDFVRRQLMLMTVYVASMLSLLFTHGKMKAIPDTNGAAVGVEEAAFGG